MTSALLRIVLGLALSTTAVAGCSVTDPYLKPGWRHLIVSVENQSARPAVIAVAEDGPTGMGKIVGTVEPGVVPPGATIDVTIGPPPEPDWAIVVNPSPRNGPLVTAHEIPPGASGRVPLALQVSSSGEAGWWVKGSLPGWLGN